jgi:hypothetical protein
MSVPHISLTLSVTMVPSCVFSWLHPTRWGASKPFSPANLALAEDSFLIALAVAKQQGARSFELRAALALAKLFQSTGRGVAASSRPLSKALR